ncbi:putative nucleotide-diphospho-sugar transferase [Thiolinea disciformis]|uniref:putative nucleotide-diphospho-sugar transferase n=1 Tax=Thiolinea disciformis TaxID=125614 RepID=UPI0003779C0F|nr:putative nucleotide-diphospho-sugar transferase [Thiolinea disciformis]
MSDYNYQHEITWLAGGQAYIVCAYFTANYLDEIKSLHQSLVHLSINHYIYPHEDLGYWEKNTRAKPAFILKCLNHFPNHHIVYTDADSVFRKNPALFENLNEDIAIFKAPDKSGYFTHDYLTSTVYFKNNEKSRALLQQWMDEQHVGALQVDQDSFDIAVKKIPDLTIYPLPFSYVKVFDQNKGIEPVIEHFQASRKQVKLKNHVRRWRNRVLGLIVLLLVLWLIYKLFAAS